MTEETLITPEIKAMLGKEEYFPGIEVVDRSSIRRYAQAISDSNPLYLDDEYAKQSKYGGIVAPPTYIFDVSHDIFAEIGEDGRDLTRVTVPGMNAVRGGNEYEFLEPVKAGDVVNRRRKVTDIYEKEGKKADKILFITYETTYVNQNGTALAICRETMMFLKQL